MPIKDSTFYITGPNPCLSGPANNTLIEQFVEIGVNIELAEARVTNFLHLLQEYGGHMVIKRRICTFMHMCMIMPYQVDVDHYGRL